ncbi:DNA primase family protein [Bradyrhizobium diazoefficiens]|uniref:DNA primase family protein n=1 Tax=Bradyrhizobium diazoefficiens TaxID=1355477 RepID=UPI0015B3DBA8|nr:DNA primase family protein [Bradyrhizobium diazoefficiens]QLD40518.1 hypothetical protein HUW42_05685 [Bradyrhizobium diazoefficiens]
MPRPIDLKTPDAPKAEPDQTQQQRPKSSDAPAAVANGRGTNDTKKLPFHVRLAELYLDHMMEQHGRALNVVPDAEGQDHFWKYENGLWAQIADSDVARWLEPELQLVLNDDLDLKRKSNNKLFAEATRHIIRSPAIRKPLPNFSGWDAHGKIPTKAGLIDPLTLDDIKPIRKEDYCTSRLDIDYDRDAKYPWWERMLADAFADRTSDDRATTIKMLQELSGLSLIANRPKALARALLLIGPPDSGKSGLLNVLSKLLSLSDNPNTTALRDLDKTHGLQAFLRRGVPWVLHEAFEDNIWHLSSEAKMIISGDPIPINPKGARPITIRPYAPAFWASNHQPKFKDSSGAIAKRLLIVKFTARFDKEKPIGAAAEARERNPTWGPEDLILNTERAGVFNWALAGLKRALQRGYLVNTAAGKADLDDIEKTANVVAGFLADCIDYDADVMITSVDFFAAFSKWWSEHHGDEKSRLSPSLVGGHLAALRDPRIVQDKNRFKNRKGLRFYIGIKLNDVGKEFFESCLSEEFGSAKVHAEFARMSLNFAATIREIPGEWLDHADITQLKAAARAKAAAGCRDTIRQPR